MGLLFEQTKVTITPVMPPLRGPARSSLHLRLSADLNPCLQTGYLTMCLLWSNLTAPEDLCLSRSTDDSSLQRSTDDSSLQRSTDTENYTDINVGNVGSMNDMVASTEDFPC